MISFCCIFCIANLVEHDRPTHGQRKTWGQKKNRETRSNLEVTFPPKSLLPSFLISSSLLTSLSPFFLSLTWGALHCPLMLLKRKKSGKMKERRCSIPLGLYFYLTEDTCALQCTHAHAHTQAWKESTSMYPEVMNRASDVMRLLLDKDNPACLCMHATGYSYI